MTNLEAYAAFCNLRWFNTNSEPVCPHYNCAEAHHMTTRQKLKCKACARQFSVTSGTIFASRKLSYRDHLLAIAIFMNCAKGYAALHLSRDLDGQYKTGMR